MSVIGNWLWGTSQLDEAVDKATSEMLPAGAEDIALNLEICDQIRSKSVPAKDAMRALKRRLNHTNPNVRNLALSLTDICVKNGGDLFLVEVASREFIDNLVSILKIPGLNIDVKNNILRHIQNWSIAFEGKPTLSYVGTVYKTLTSEGYKFPPKDLSLANSAMVDTQQAPEWIDSDVCLRCRTPFTFTNRKHHCRNCGQVFDQQCSAKVLPLPHFGITQDVRVCDSCYPKLVKKNERSGGGNESRGHRHSKSLGARGYPGSRDATDADLQRAIQLSLQEVGAANGRTRAGYTPYQPEYQYSEPPIVERATHPRTSAVEDDDPDLRAAIEASLRESAAPRPSAPMAIETPRTEEPGFAYKNGPGYSQSYPSGLAPPQQVARAPAWELAPVESDAILTFSQTVEQVQMQGGRDMTRYPAVNELYDKANSLRPKLAMSMDDAGKKEQMLSDMHDKLSQAVKLYDKLLTEHVVQPRWQQSPQPAANGAYPYPQQWQGAPAQPSQYTPASAEAAQQQWYGQPQQPQYTGAQPLQPQYTGAQPQYAGAQPQQPQYTGQVTYAPQPPHAQYAPPPPPQTQYTPPAQQQQQPQYPSPTPAPPSQFTPQQPQYQQQTAGPSQPVTYAPQPQVAQPSAPSFQQPVYAQSPPPAQPAQATPPAFQQPVYAQSPPPPTPQQQHYAPPLSESPGLSRHNTIAATASSPPASNASYLARSNTVAAPSHAAVQRQYSYQAQPAQPQQHQQQQQQPQYAAPAQALPSFPVAPTSAPQAYSLYGPSMAAPTTMPVQKEAAPLIDL
ncbi:Vacuolar protein sorting-associated protein 27 [Mycena kentingensis (nom. inval.)]|nr:Vacuolar protein sorting-associated protein 27 [Mycena kentingensis (nom. inval.)]